MLLGIVISFLSMGATEPVLHQDFTVAASSDAGGKYTAEMAVDGNGSTRWASQNNVILPQWFELRFATPRKVDYLQLRIAVDAIYAPWAAMELSFSEGAPIQHVLDASEDIVALRFPARTTESIRITIQRVHEQRNYVGLYECVAAYDPDKHLAVRASTPKPLAQDQILIRGRTIHPCVNMTPADVTAAKQRVATKAWAAARRDAIVAEADKWLREEDAYWLSFLPEAGACYAYGFTACPICNGKTGIWYKANCSWDTPGQVRCANGHSLPDAAHPDDGTGYTAPDGRIHYFVGQFNAWVTEQWTLFALPSLSQAYLLTDDERYAERAALLLDALASIYKESTAGSWDYPSDPPSGRFARPWYQVARTLVKYVDHYDRIYHSPALSAPSLRPGYTRRENIEQNMLLDGAYYCYAHSFDGALHNGHADYMRGALAVGCLLDIPEYIRIAVEGPFSIHTMLANNLDRDGRYYESSLGYAIHARLLYLTYGDPLYNLRNEEYPEGINLYDDPALRTAILLPDTQVMLAGRRPNFGDSAPDFRHIPPAPPQPNASDIAFLERLYARTDNPQWQDDYAALLRWCAPAGEDRLRGMPENAGHPTGFKEQDWALWHARDLAYPKETAASLSAPYARRMEGSWVAGMKGLAMLRAGDQAVLLRYGPSLNHGDPDDLGLHYYAKGYQLSYDIGYGLGSTHCQVGWASSTVAHCLVTVNEQNQLAADGSGGSLHWFADLPGVKAVSASAEASYTAEQVSTYQRTLALVDATYLVDIFQVTGGSQHDFGFGSIGTALIPFGVGDVEAVPGSLAEGVDWGRNVGADGDIIGYPQKPYWNPPPKNGYGFFKEVRKGIPEAYWGGDWRIPGEPGLQLRMHIAGDSSEAIVAQAPGLYPDKPDASYIIARRSGAAPLTSTFIAVYEPYEESPLLAAVKRIGPSGVEIQRKDGVTDILLLGAQEAACSLGSIGFEGDVAYLQCQGTTIIKQEIQGCTRLELNGRPLPLSPGIFEATVLKIDPDTCRVQLDRELPEAVQSGVMAVFDHPAYGRTTGYPVRSGDGDSLVLEAGSLSLGTGRVWEIRGGTTLLSDIPHEYAKQVRRKASKFFDGKIIQGEHGGNTRVRSVQPGSPMTLTVDATTSFRVGEQFSYLDIAPGDTVRIALPQ